MATSPEVVVRARPVEAGAAPARSRLAGDWPLGVLLAAAIAVRVFAPSAVEGRAEELVARAAGVVAALLVAHLALRWGAWRWLAALAALPAAVGPAQVAASGRGVLEPLLVLVVVTGLAAVLWRVPAGLLASAGALLAAVAASLVLLGLSAGGDRGPLAVLAPLARGGALDVRDQLRGPWSTDALPGTGPLVTVEVVVAALGLLLALAAAAGLGRARPSRLRRTALVLAVVPLLFAAGALVDGVTPAVVLPALAVLPAAGAVGLTALLRGRRGRRSGPVPPDDVDRAAVADLHARVGVPELPPVAIVIAAYDEAPGIGAVLAGLPAEVLGLRTAVVVVDDGSTDGTAEAVAASGRALAVACPANRGQGAALRLGYRVAREHGARYVVTTDADGQYDVGDVPALLRPVVEGEADFVSGSRRLGHQHTRDRVRRTGVHVFAWVVSAMSGTRVTDTSFGLRAMRADLTGVVTLRQPQYQSSELMLGVLSHGYRVREVPATMHVRSAGASKKGRNLVYGSRYARVVVGTWWREGLLTPADEVAPALRGSALRGRAPGGSGGAAPAAPAPAP
ncbi:glycosyltransferase family 2 protein [uncultured Pseudokineococcus sp.]|uniref:glycosyltransferase family 2 protein n=1 Tax=uncultured Pseudokineococcus sp. TaxID=1642928 RepID=UPI0026360524|nr:glycosyltransferase family 2 protein [uncultured Pseudokineococcus sp.]